MIARFIYDIKLSDKPDKETLKFYGLPSVDKWTDLNAEQIKDYAKGEMFYDHNDANEVMGNYKVEKIQLI